MTADTLTPSEERLLEELERHRRELPAPPLPRPRSRRRLRVGAVALAIAVAAALALGDTTQSRPARAATAAEVTRRAQSALLDARNLIVHSTTRSSNGTVTQSWEDERTGTRLSLTRLHGKLVTASLLVQRPGLARRTFVSYGQRAWIRLDRRVPPGTRIVRTYASEPEELREELRRHQTVLLGREKLGSRDTMHLTRIVPGSQRRSGPVHQGPTRLHIWVDADTYLPLRLETRGSFDGIPNHNVTDCAWLARTDANVARTKLTIPPGFRHLKHGSLSVSPTGMVTLTPGGRP
jgi:hypothetical protein